MSSLGLLAIGLVISSLVLAWRWKTASPSDAARRAEIATRYLATREVAPADFEFMESIEQPVTSIDAFVHAIQLATIAHGENAGWATHGPTRRQLAPQFQRWLNGPPPHDPWTLTAAVMPLLVVRDVDAAVRAYRRLEPRPDLQRQVVSFARQTFMGGQDNDLAVNGRFLQTIGVPVQPHPPMVEEDRYPPAKRWALSCNVFPDYSLDDRSALPDIEPSPSVRRSEEAWWNVTDTASARRVLSSLLEEGHRAQFARNAGGDEDPREVARFTSAWDLCRLTQVARSAHKLGYLDEAETWRWLLAAARDLQRNYRGWIELGDGYLEGLRRFDPGGDRYHEACVRWLQRSQQSPWRRLPWDLDLGAREPPG